MVNTGRLTDKVKEEIEQLPGLTKYDCHIERATIGGGLILCHKGKSHSEIKDTNKYRDAVCEELKIPRNDFDLAVTSAKRKTIDGLAVDENPGAIVVKIAKNHAIEFFRDQYHTGYATITVKGDDGDKGDDYSESPSAPALYTVEPLEVLKDLKTSSPSSPLSPKKIFPINSKQFKWWIADLYHKTTKQTASSEAIKAASLVLEAQTQNQPIRTLYNRFAPNGDLSYWWDMGDDYGRAIHYDKDGWEVVYDTPPIFRRYPHTIPLPMPTKDGNLALFLPYLSLNEPGDKLLAIVATISYLIPEVPHIGTTITGRQGTGKSTLHRLMQNLIDPSSADLLTLPSKNDDLIQTIEHHYLSIFDNIGNLTSAQSDILCRAITGGGNEKRELYTTDDSFIRRFIRCIGINGISVPIEKSDLFSRNALFPWVPIKPGERKTDAEMMDSISDDTPKLIGAMLDVIVKAINIYPDVKPTLNARMADFVKWGIAITKSIGLTQNDFEEAYKANLSTQDDEIIKSSVVAEQVIRYMEETNQTVLEGPSTTIKTSIEEWVNPLDGYGRPTGDLLSKKPGWPRTANSFSTMLNDVAEALEAFGYVFSKSRTKRSRGIKIEKRSALGSDGDGQKTFDLVKIPLTDERLLEALSGEVVDPVGEIKIIEVPKSIMNQFKRIIELMKELDEKASPENMFAAWSDELGITSLEEFKKLILVLGREGTIYQPTPGYWRLTES